MKITRLTGANPSSAAASPAPAKTRETAQKSPREDQLTLSQQAKALLEEQQRRRAELKKIQEDAQKMKEAGAQQAEALAKSLKVRLQCWKIAGRIMDGDKVPYEDEQFLLSHDPSGYQMAMSLRKVKEDPEEWDSLLEEEEEGSTAGEGGAAVSGRGEGDSGEESSGGEVSDC